MNLLLETTWSSMHTEDDLSGIAMLYTPNPELLETIGVSRHSSNGLQPAQPTKTTNPCLGV